VVIFKKKTKASEKKKIKYWVHPILAEIFTQGTFQTLIGELKSDETKFFNYFRMSMTSLDDPLARERKHKNTKYNTRQFYRVSAVTKRPVKESSTAFLSGRITCEQCHIKC
jgi:hypothetical protein